MPKKILGEGTPTPYMLLTAQVKKQIILKDRNVVIVDDIISTGHTMIEALKEARKAGAKTVTAIGVHGLFVEGALDKLKRAGARVVTTNTVANSVSEIDVSETLAKVIEKELK